MGFMDFLRLFRMLSRSERKHLKALSEYLDGSDYRHARWMIKQRKAAVAFMNTGVSLWLVVDVRFPQMHALIDDAGVRISLKKWNDIISDRVRKRQINEFAKVADQRLPACLAPQVQGLDAIKVAVALQLVSSEGLQILLFGDADTGKAEIVRSAVDIHSSVWQGSGTAFSQAKPQASICAIDELNLKQRAASVLSRSMDGNTLRILASSTPIGNRIVGQRVSIMREQIPVERALLDSFHIVFCVRAATAARLTVSPQITPLQGRLTQIDKDFLKAFCDSVESIKVEFPEELEKDLLAYAKELKAQEGQYLVAITNRRIQGILRMSQAIARLSLRRRVLPQDLERAKEIMKTALDAVV